MPTEAPNRPATAEAFMALPYRLVVYWDEDYWAVEFPELPGLVVGHETWEALPEQIEVAKRVYFETALEAGKTIPLPSEPNEPSGPSGKVALRLPRSLHQQAVRAAAREGVSLNTFLVAAVAQQIGRRGGA